MVYFWFNVVRKFYGIYKGKFLGMDVNCICLKKLMIYDFINKNIGIIYILVCLDVFVILEYVSVSKIVDIDLIRCWIFLDNIVFILGL